MYLREMGTVPLLDREGEVEIAQRIEQGEWLVYEALCENPVVLRELLRLNELAEKDKKVLYELDGDRSGRAARPQGGRPHQAEPQDLRADRQARPRDPEAAQASRSSYKRRAARKCQEYEREIDRVVGKIAKEIRTIDFSVQTRNRLVDFLKDIDRQFSRFEQDIKRAQTALKNGVEQGAAGAPPPPHREVPRQAPRARGALRHHPRAGRGDASRRSARARRCARRPRRS